jgi:GlpG protein
VSDHQGHEAAETSFPLFEQAAATIRRAPWFLRNTPVTMLLCAVILFIFVGMHVSTSTHAVLWKFCWRPAFDVWRYRHASLLTSSVMHLEYWHVGLNLFGIARFGSTFERVLGSTRTLLFIIAAAVVSSSVQLGLFEDTGFGASGIGYAFFGFGWASRSKSDLFKATFTKKVSLFWMVWFVGCFLLAFRAVANGAHLGGLAFGVSVAVPYVSGRAPWLARSLPVAVSLMALAVGLVCPWSPVWWATKGFEAHSRGAYAAAADAYRFSLKLRPDQPWVLENLAKLERHPGSSTQR